MSTYLLRNDNKTILSQLQNNNYLCINIWIGRYTEIRRVYPHFHFPLTMNLLHF